MKRDIVLLGLNARQNDASHAFKIQRIGECRFVGRCLHLFW
jgi:hypothetical protein